MQLLQNCIGPTICIGREIQCLPYAGFFYQQSILAINRGFIGMRIHWDEDSTQLLDLTVWVGLFAGCMCMVPGFCPTRTAQLIFDLRLGKITRRI